MAIYYEEFDTTVGGLVAALQSKIAGHASWDAFVPTSVPTFTNISSFTGNVVTFTVSSVAGLFVGQRVKVVVASVPYARTITDITGLNITINTGLTVTTPVAATWTVEVNLVKATTTRGADMIVDLQAGNDATELYRLNLRFWRTLPANYGTASTTEEVERYVWWRNNGGSLTHTVHVTLSVGKEHLFIALEGPRWNETGAISSNYGSFKSYAFISDVAPYHAADTTPFVAAGASPWSGGANGTTLGGNHEVDISRNFANTLSWTQGRLGSLMFPVFKTQDAVPLTRDCTIDGKTYLFPYVLASNAEGMRGRLARFFFAGLTHPSPITDIGDPVGSKVTFEGVTYKLLAVTKSDSSTQVWGQFGAISNNNTAAVYSSVVVAVPFSE